MRAVVANLNSTFPCNSNQFIMQVLIQSGYSNKVLHHLNRVRMSQQLLFMLDVLTALGNTINLEVLTRRSPEEAWSNMTWPTEHPPELYYQLWRRAMLSICPSQTNRTRVGQFTGPTHRIQQWTWNKDKSMLHSLRADSMMEDVFIPSRKPIRFYQSHCQPHSNLNTICLVEPTLGKEGWHLTSSEPHARQAQRPTSFLDILQLWGNTWLWEHLQVMGGETWIHDSIADSLLVAVTDRLYIREIYPNLCSATFIMECSKVQGRIMGSFLEALLVANAYRGELLGLMGIHLILLSVNKLHSDLLGSVEIVSDCRGALKCVTYLLPYHIPSQCCHSNILKTILVH